MGWKKHKRERDEGGAGMWTKDTLINGITIEPITAKTLEILLLKINLNDNEYLIIMIYYVKQESRTNQKQKP